MAANSFNFIPFQHPEFRGKSQFPFLAGDPWGNLCGAELWAFPEPITMAPAERRTGHCAQDLPGPSAGKVVPKGKNAGETELCPLSCEPFLTSPEGSSASFQGLPEALVNISLHRLPCCTFLDYMPFHLMGTSSQRAKILFALVIFCLLSIVTLHSSSPCWPLLEDITGALGQDWPVELMQEIRERYIFIPLASFLRDSYELAMGSLGRRQQSCQRVCSTQLWVLETSPFPCAFQPCSAIHSPVLYYLFRFPYTLPMPDKQLLY